MTTIVKIQNEGPQTIQIIRVDVVLETLKPHENWEGYVWDGALLKIIEVLNEPK